MKPGDQSSGVTPDYFRLKFYDEIEPADMSLIYACLAKIRKYKEYRLYKDIESIAKTWMMIKLDNINVVSNTGENKIISKSFWVPYLINGSDYKKFLEDKPANFSRKLRNCLYSAATGKNVVDDKKEDTNIYNYDDIDKLLIELKKNIKKPTLEPFMAMSRKGYKKKDTDDYVCGKTFCDVPSQIATKIYEAWKNIYNKENKLNDENFLEIFKNFNGDISKFFKAFLFGVDCSGYVNQVYGQWMLDQGKKIEEMIETIGPNSDGTKCRDNCLHIREEEAGNKKYSLYHIGYFFPIDEIKNKQPKSINIWNRKKNGDISVFTKVKKEKGKEYETIDMSTVNEVVKSNLKAGDLISFVNNNKKGAHYAIVEKTGVNEQGQWYFCITESTEADKVGWKDLKTGHIYKKDEDKKPWDGVRNDQGYYTSIEDFMDLRESQYDFFWFCRPKAINEYYNSI
jgi:hypothetical protein